MTVMLASVGEWSGNVRSTPMPSEILRTVNVLRMPAPGTFVTRPRNFCWRSLSPSITRTMTSTVKPGRRSGRSALIWVFSTFCSRPIAGSFQRGMARGERASSSSDAVYGSGREPDKSIVGIRSGAGRPRIRPQITRFGGWTGAVPVLPGTLPCRPLTGSRPCPADPLERRSLAGGEPAAAHPARRRIRALAKDEVQLRHVMLDVPETVEVELEHRHVARLEAAAPAGVGLGERRERAMELIPSVGEVGEKLARCV